VHPNQPELWCAEPHQAPRIYSQLNPQQRNRLIFHLAFLMLKLVRNQTTKLPPTPVKAHER
jgi:hypothetical protein